MSTTHDTQEFPGADLELAARHELISVPVADTATTAAIMDRIERLRNLSDGLMKGIEKFTALTVTDVIVLKTILAGVSHPRHIGRKVGMDTDTTCVLVESLVERGLVYIEERIGDRIIDVQLSDAGHAALNQAEAVQFRAVDALLQQASPTEVQDLFELLDAAATRATVLVASVTRSS
ncbi:MarR family winged helix-turn-helix transcriptional regulator [Jonesia quinghaiensis]|uniref:MarR family winged helix-turn-helix transcriptional regulator n=1 Tax=Jonesia quinghaiensis TaxID=262806 RepID=UPI000403D0F8|nr:MarR family winged helix-turn-helix transcriptional regulator [Jonesia quinghaiensis]